MAGSKPPPRSAPAAVQHRQAELTIREGPLPAPHELLEYDRLVPGAADRIIAMAEREQAGRMNLEDLTQRADIKHREDLAATQREATRAAFRGELAGQLLGWTVALGCVAGAVYTAAIGASPWVSVALVSLPVATIVKAVRNMKDDGGK